MRGQVAVCSVVVLVKRRYYVGWKDDLAFDNNCQLVKHRANLVSDNKTHWEVNRLDWEAESDQKRNLPDREVLIKQRNIPAENELNLLQVWSFDYTYLS